VGFIGARRHTWALVVVFAAIFLGGYASQSWVSTLNAMKRMFEHQTYNEREETPLEKAVGEKWAEGEILLKHLPRKDGQSDAFFPMLDDAIFVGHLVTDLDSIAGAIGAAHLYGGAPARASEINTETEFALNLWGVDLPPPVEELLAATPDRNVCLVDFQQQSQLNKAIPMGNIVGVIDHHALQSNTIVTEKPIFVDIRPWGCMSSIIAHSFAVQERYLPKNIAGMLLSAILSDTLNLKSPTTTAWDERVAAMLVQYLGVDDINELAATQFRAKSRALSLMTPYSLVNGDMKQFKFTGADDSYTVAYSVIETTDAEASLARVLDILPEMRAVKADDPSVHAMLLAVVDIVNLTSTLVICGRVEASLAVAAYGGSIEADGHLLRLPGLVSRKKDFIPPLTKAVKDGWQPPRLSTDGTLNKSTSMTDIPHSEVIVTPEGKLVRADD
jgi:manganese-dependent inorganic pyrophosphatase